METLLNMRRNKDSEVDAGIRSSPFLQWFGEQQLSGSKPIGAAVFV